MCESNAEAAARIAAAEEACASKKEQAMQGKTVKMGADSAIKNAEDTFKTLAGKPTKTLTPSEEKFSALADYIKTGYADVYAKMKFVPLTHTANHPPPVVPMSCRRWNNWWRMIGCSGRYGRGARRSMYTRKGRPERILKVGSTNSLFGNGGHCCYIYLTRLPWGSTDRSLVAHCRR